MSTANQWLTRSDIAEELNVSCRTVSGWMRSGLRYSKVGRLVRVKRSDLDAFLEGHAVEGNEIDDLVNEICADILH